MGKLNVVAEPGALSIVMTREFDAPPELIWRAYTDPTLIPKWWGPSQYETIVDKMDFKVGGMWRYVQRGADGDEHAFFGVYHEITAPYRIVSTNEYEGMPGHSGLEVVSFEEANGKTVMTNLAVFQSVEDRDGMIASGMEAGANETWDRLEELVKTSQPSGA